MPKYTYRDFVTGKQRWTRGKFAGWVESTGPLKTKYAIFQRKGDDILVPEYLLSQESLVLIEKGGESCKINHFGIDGQSDCVRSATSRTA